MRGAAHAASRERVFAAIALVTAAVVMAPASRALSAEAPSGTRITGVAVRDRGGDATVVVVTFDGPIAGHRRFHMGGEAPRALLRISGIVEAYRPYEVPVDDGRVLRVRIGHHPELDPPEEHLVFDLADVGVTISRVVEEELRLTVVLEKTAPGETARPAPRPARTPTPSPSPTPSPTPMPSLTPTASRTATAVPPPTATSVPPTPTAIATRSGSTPTPRASRPTRRAGAAAPSPTPEGPPARSPLPRPPGFAGPLLRELVISYREDGSALVRLSVDRTFEGADVRYLGVRGAPPRNVLALTGVGLPGEGAVLPVRDGLLCEIQVLLRADAEGPRTEVVLFLASAEVRAERAAVKGAHAVVLLLPPPDPEAPLDCEVEDRSGNKGWRFVAEGPPQPLR